MNKKTNKNNELSKKFFNNNTDYQKSVEILDQLLQTTFYYLWSIKKIK